MSHLVETKQMGNWALSKASNIEAITPPSLRLANDEERKKLTQTLGEFDDAHGICWII